RDVRAYALWQQAVQRVLEEGGREAAAAAAAAAATGQLNALSNKKSRKSGKESILEPPKKLLRHEPFDEQLALQHYHMLQQQQQQQQQQEGSSPVKSEDSSSSSNSSSSRSGPAAASAGEAAAAETGTAAAAAGAITATAAAAAAARGFSEAAKEEDDDAPDQPIYGLEPYDSSLEEEEEAKLPDVYPSGIQRRKDDASVDPKVNHHMFLLLRFLDLFAPHIGLEDWSFEAVYDLVVKRELNEFGARFFSRLTALIGRRYTPGNNLSKCLCKIMEDRSAMDFNFLFPLGINPFLVRVWEDVKPYQRLRCIRVLLNAALGDSTAIHNVIDSWGPEKKAAFLDGSFFISNEGFVFWFISEHQKPHVFKIYKEDQAEGTLEIVAETLEQLEALAEAEEAKDPPDEFFPSLLREKHSDLRAAAEAAAAAAAAQRELEQQQQLLRQQQQQQQKGQ
ncbi:hypothetical protein, conserved, partial [Eimeria tenella]